MKRNGAKNMRRGYPAIVITAFALCLVVPSLSAYASEQASRSLSDTSAQVSAIARSASSASIAEIVKSADASDAVNSQDGVVTANAAASNGAATASQTVAGSQSSDNAAVEIPDNETALASAAPAVGFPWGLTIALVSMVCAGTAFLFAIRKRHTQWR